MMRRAIAALLTLLMLTVTASAEMDREVDPYDIDAAFMRGYFDGVQWDRHIESLDDEVKLTESAMIDGHDYSFTVVGSLIGVDEAFFLGWFSDMEMLDDGLFAHGLYAYNACFGAVSEMIPDGDEAYDLFNAYDIYPVVLSGELYDAYYGPWRVTQASPGIIEAVHNAGWFIRATRVKDVSGSYSGEFMLYVGQM